MAEIKLTATTFDYGGPTRSSPFRASVQQREMYGGIFPVLCLRIGIDSLEIYPADPEHVYDLGLKLQTIGRELGFDAAEKEQ